MSWLVEYTDEFGAWWDGLAETVQNDISAVVELLIGQGPELPFPYSSDVKGSRHGHMRELRVQSGGKPIRIFYAFDPRRFYERKVPAADDLYDEHLLELRKERLIK